MLRGPSGGGAAASGTTYVRGGVGKQRLGLAGGNDDGRYSSTRQGVGDRLGVVGNVQAGHGNIVVDVVIVGVVVVIFTACFIGQSFGFWRRGVNVVSLVDPAVVSRPRWSMT